MNGGGDDGREEALATYVEQRSRPGDIDQVIGTIDDFCYRRTFMMNVGDEKGAILEDVIHRAEPVRLLELGAYCGYSALRMIRAVPPAAHLWSIEISPANAAIARRVIDHAGVARRVSVVVGSLGDGGQTIGRLETEHGFDAGNLDLVFIDHDKDAYHPDLERILERRWLHRGSIVVADNVLCPGAPEYHSYMTRCEGEVWRTTEHDAHVEYQAQLRDLVLESQYLRD